MIRAVKESGAESQEAGCAWLSAGVVLLLKKLGSVFHGCSSVFQRLKYHSADGSFVEISSFLQAAAAKSLLMF